MPGSPRTNLLRIACASAIVAGLGGCGGGGGGGQVAVIPPPPPSPTPTPTPTPTAFSIFAPANASVGSTAGAPVFAGQGGPNFTTGPSAGTKFPLLQTTMVYDDKSARPDAQVNASGGSASIQGGALTIDVAAFQNADVKFLSSDYANLDWTRVGYWSTGGGWWDADDVVGRSGVFVTGYETPAAAVPTTGSATYTGAVQGTVLYPGTSAGTTHCNCVVETLAGNASFTANFGTRNVSGSLTSMTAGGVPWNSVAFNSTITGNSFSGTTSVTTTPAGPASLAPNATGTVEGRFFGPSAQEAGAVWTLFDGVKAAIGTLTGKGP